MKNIGKGIEAFTMSLLIILSTGCSIYQNRTATVDEALNSGGKVKVVTVNDATYIFKVLQRDDERLYGIARKGSATSKNLDGVIVGRNMKIPLKEDNIEKIHLKDETKSTLATIAIPVVIVGGLITAAVISMNNWDWN